jgi:Ca-activated chloride channel family protein
MKCTLKFVDHKNAPLSGAKVTLKETSQKGKVELVTNSLGVVTTTLSVGKEWAIFVNGFQMRRLIEIPENGEGTMSLTDTYDPEMSKRFAMQDYVRTGYTVSNSTYEKGKQPPKGYLLDIIYVVTKQGQPVTDVEVAMVNVATKTKMIATTDYSGNAYFWVKTGEKYDIDVDGKLNISFADMPKEEGLEITETVRFQPATFSQKIKNDTIVQDLKGEIEPASGYQYFRLQVFKDGVEAVNEDVYLWDVKGTEVYQGVTNAEGILEMMLPIRRKFMIDFNYQKDVDVVDLSMSYGGGSSTRNMRLSYIPDPKLEHPELFIPTPDQLVLQDFHTFANKQYPKKKKVGIYASFQGKVNAQSKEAILEIGINTNFKPSQAKLNIAFVIDRSGSMAGYDRIERLKDALVEMMPKLPADATISILTYDDVMNIVLNPQKIGTSAQTITNLISEIQPGGGTNMLETMNKGYEFVTANFDPKAVNKVILMTDGWDVNEVQVLVDAQAKFPKIECSTIGIGKDFNYALLSILAEKGKGKLFYVESEGSYDSVFVNGMVANLMPVAVDVTVEVEYNDKIVYKHLYGYQPLNADKNPATFKIPNLYTESTEFALAKFDLINPDSTIENQPVIIRVQYTNPESGLKEVSEEKVFLDWEPFTGEMELIADKQNKKLYCIAILNQSIKVMSDLFAAGNVEEAKLTIQRAKDQVKEIYKDATDKDINQLMRSLEDYLQAFKNLAKKKHK